MAVSATHRGWLLKHNEGLLAAVYNGALPGTTLLAANTALDGVFIGTPVVPALAVDTMVLSNMVASGDILIATNSAGNSQAWLWIDTSAGLMTLYRQGVSALELGANVVFNEASADRDFRVETNGIQYAIYADGGKDALVLGSNTDTSSTDQLITVSRAARTATTTVNYYDFVIAPAGAVTIPAGTTAVVATAAFNEPNITATGTVTNATTVYIVAAPTEGGTGNYALWVDAGITRIDGNLDMSDSALDIVMKANTAAALEISDGTTKLLTFDTRNTVTVQNLLIDAPASQTLPNAATSQFRNVTIAAHTVTLVGTTQVTTVNQGAQLCILGATYNQSGGAVTVNQVSTLHVAVITAGASVTITANRMISTGVSDCYLTVGGVWTDTVCTQKYKQEIAELDMAKMPSLLEKIHPVTFKYDRKKLGENGDFNRQRYGVIAEELPDFLRVPGEASHSVMNGTVLSAFGLAGLRYLHEQNKTLTERLVKAEAQLAALAA